MIEIVLLQSAQDDLLEIYILRGEASYRLIDRVLEMIRTMPESAPVYCGDFRRKLVADSPYGIFYTRVGSRVMVSFIMDLRQDPASIRKRLRRGR